MRDERHSFDAFMGRCLWSLGFAGCILAGKGIVWFRFCGDMASRYLHSSNLKDFHSFLKPVS